MKIGDRFDLKNPQARAYLQKVIDAYGFARNTNEIGASVLCRTENGDEFELLTFYRANNMVTVCAL